MKTFKSLLAVSVLSVAGTAGAATVGTFDVAQTITSVMYGGSELLIQGSGVGSAVLDDSGFLDITITAGRTETQLTDTTTASIAHILGSWDGSTFTSNLSGSTSTITSCTNNGGKPINGCSSITLNSPQPFDSLSGSITLAGGTVNTAQTNSGATTSGYFTLTGTTTPPPQVPIPAAAWLFGSGLLGLAGTARRRRNNAAV